MLRSRRPAARNAPTIPSADAALDGPADTDDDLAGYNAYLKQLNKSAPDRNPT